jgi:glycosyltransferase involved in cell wall biosynthesis
VVEGLSRPGVLHLIDSLEPGGAERVAVNLVNALPRERFRPFLCATRREGPLAARVRPDVEVLSLGRRSTLDLAAWRRLARFVREREIAIVHAHSSSLFLASLLPVRLVWHDHFGRFEREERPDWLYRLALRRAAAVVSVSEGLAGWARERLQIAPERVHYLPNFVEVSPPGEIPDLPGAPGRRIVCVAHFREQKDHPTLIRALARVASEEPEAHLLLVGQEVEPGARARVEAEIAALGLGGNVSFLGARDDVPALLRGCDLGVLSSTSEGFPLALLDYGAAGLAAVATRVGQCVELLEEGEAGRLVPPRDPAALAAALLRLLRDPGLRRALGSRLAERVRARYSAAAVVGALADVYDRALTQEKDRS